MRYIVHQQWIHYRLTPKTMRQVLRRGYHHSMVRRNRAVFDEPLKTLHYGFSADKADAHEYTYLREEMAAQLVDRLGDIKRSFPVAVDLGARGSSVLQALVNEAEEEEEEEEDGRLPGGIQKLTQIDNGESVMRQIGAETDRLRNGHGKVLVGVETKSVECSLADIDKALPENSVDIVFSNLALHWTNDLAGTFSAINRVLKPDGVMLASIFAGDTLFELRTALSIAEQEREGGISPHVSPMIKTADGCSLLNAAGFTLTTVDTVNIEVEFDNAFALMEHLAAMGESNAVLSRRPGMSRETLLGAAAAYSSMFVSDEGFVPASFQIACLIGWKRSENQPQPKPIGSGEASLGSIGQSYDFTRHSHRRGKEDE